MRPNDMSDLQAEEPRDIFATSVTSGSGPTTATALLSSPQHVHNRNVGDSRHAEQPESPSILSSCMSDALTGEENASFCDPFSDGEDDDAEAAAATAPASASESVPQVPTASRATTASSRPTDSRRTSSRISVAESDFSTTVFRRVTGMTKKGAAPPPPEAAELIAVSSWSEADDIVPNNAMSGTSHDRPSSTNNGGCCWSCNYAGVRSSVSPSNGIRGGGGGAYDYDCICQHSCSSSISSLGSPDLDTLEETDEQPSACNNATDTSRSKNDVNEDADMHDDLMNVFDTHREADHDGETCIADDEDAGSWNQDGDDSDTSNSNDSVPTIDDCPLINVGGRGGAAAATSGAESSSEASSVDHVPAIVQLFGSSGDDNRVQVQQLSRPSSTSTVADLSQGLVPKSSFSSVAATDNNHYHQRGNTDNTPLPYPTQQMVQKASEHRTKMMCVVKAPRQPSGSFERASSLASSSISTSFVSPHAALLVQKSPKKSDRLTTAFMPDEMVTKATSYLDVKSLLHLRVTCRTMRDLASRDEAGWFDACRRLWKHKVNISPEAIEMIESGGQIQRRKNKRRKLKRSTLSSSGSGSAMRRSYGAMGAYRVSSIDARERDVITIDELCYDGASSSNAVGRSHLDVDTRKRRSSANARTMSSQESSQSFSSSSGHEFHGPVWSFRFKESAGPDWTGWDPWWNGEKARTMVFLRDGTVKQIVAKTDLQSENADGEDEDGATGNALRANQEEEDGRIREEDRANGYVLRSSFSDGLNVADGHRREGGTGAAAAAARGRGIVRDPVEGGIVFGQRRHAHPRPKIDIRWRFISNPMDMPSRPEGAYIRLIVGNRDVPTYVVRRSPTGNWGFLLESCWGLYASFELPKNRAVGLSNNANSLQQQQQVAGQVPAPINVNAPAGARMRLRRTRYGGRWMNVNGIESDEDDEGEGRVEPNNSEVESLLEDAAMTVTNGRQWREALLYNYGADTLPEGRNAAEHFNRVWREREY